MSTQPLGITNFGAFTELTAQKIAQAIAQQGFATTGNVYYVDPVNGNDLANGQAPVANPGQSGTGPVQSLGAGYALLVEGHNDVLVLIGNGLSTGSARIHATFTWAKDAAHLIGICAPSLFSQRARIAPGTADTGFANFFVVSGNGCYFSNVEFFQGFATGVAAEICVTVTGSRNVFNNVHIAGMGDTSGSVGAASATSRNLLVKADENYFVNSTIGLDTVTRTNSNSSVEISSNAARTVFRNCIFPTYAGDNSEVTFLAAAAAAFDRFVLFDNCTFINAIQSGATSVTGSMKLAASAGGFVLMKDCISLGFSTLYFDATSKTQVFAYGAAQGGTAFLADTQT